MPPLADTFYEIEDFTGLDCAGAELTDRTFRECRFFDCDFSNCNLSRSQFSECELKGCNVSNARLYDAKFSEVGFVDCKLTGLDFSTCNPLLFSINLARCRAAYCLFTGLNMACSNLSHSELTDCIFEGTDLTKANFSSCDLRGTTFEKASLDAADFRNAINYLIDPLTNSLSKARFSYPEALILLQPFGVIIE